MSEPPKTWLEWIDSDEGRQCADAESLKVPPEKAEFLKNRLWHAFVAGMTAHEVGTSGSASESR